MYIDIYTNIACVTNDGIHLYFIGGSTFRIGSHTPLSYPEYYSHIFRYTPPTSRNYSSNIIDDEWIFMGNMRYSLNYRGCTTDRSGKYLYMIGGFDDNGGKSFAEYIDLNEYQLNGFNDSYYFMGNIIDRQFRNGNPITWANPNCFSSNYAEDIIYCLGGQFNPNYTINGIRYPHNEIWTFERFDEYSSYGPQIGNNIISNPELYGCTKKSNNYSSPYLFYPDCAGAIGHNIKSVLGMGYPTNEVIAGGPINMAAGCLTPWYSINDNSSIVLYLGGTVEANSIIIIKEDLESFFKTSSPTNAPTTTPTKSPSNTPTEQPSMQTGIPSKPPTISPSLPPTSAPTMNPSKTIINTSSSHIISVFFVLSLVAINYAII